MPLSIIGTPGAVNAGTITLPTHAVGDLILIYAYRANSTTVPSTPTAGGTVPAWQTIDAPTGANSNSSRTARFTATATNHTSGVWTNATNMAVIVYRGQESDPMGGHAESGAASIDTATAPAVTLTKTDGSSALVHFFGTGTNIEDGWDAAPSGYTRRASAFSANANGVCINTKNSTTSDGSIGQTFGSTLDSVGYRGATVEILAVPTLGSRPLIVNRIPVFRASFY